MNVCFLIDGFNVYHSIRDIEVEGHGNYRWFDIKAFCQRSVIAFNTPETKASIHSIHYFTAPPQHLYQSNWERLARHRLYCSVIKGSGIEVHLGTYSKSDEFCANCGSDEVSYKEKRTDVSMALHAMKYGGLPDVDVVVLMTGDTDQIPTVEFFKEAYPDKKIQVIAPYNRDSVDFSTSGIKTLKMKIEHYSSFQFPDLVIGLDGKTRKKPSGW